MAKFVWALLVDRNEWLEVDNDLQCWDEFAQRDYAYHALYDIECKETPIFMGDNIHTPIETMIEYFVEGYAHATSEKISVRRGIMIWNQKDNPPFQELRFLEGEEKIF